jgi:flagellar motor switch protein FliG
MEHVSELAEMTQLRKAAILLASLNRKQAGALLHSLPRETVRRVVAEVRTLGTISSHEQDAVLAEFAEQLEGGLSARGGDRTALDLLEEGMGGEQAEEMLGQATPSLLHTVVDVPSEELARLLKEEQPAVASTILGFLPSEKAAEILQCLEPKLRTIIIGRLTVERSPQPEFLEQVEKIFVDLVMKVQQANSGTPRCELGGPKFVANVLQHVDKQTEEQIFQFMDSTTPEIAGDIRELMFTFEDIARLDDEGVQKALRRIELDQLVLVLRGAPPEVTEKIMANLSKRAQESLQEEASMLGRIKRSDVESARAAIIALLREMEESGDISLRSTGEDDAYV